MQTMPQDPVDMVDDLVKMGLYKDQQLRAADKVNTYELRKALMLKAAGKGDPKREKLVLALAKQAGGMENAFSAAFGPQAGLFFADTLRNSGFTRREFLKNLAIGAALVTLSNCGGKPDPVAEEPDAAPVDVSNLEKTDLKIG
ncbi:MAG: twin-arginine translocation signal domain-containing protein, partial [Cyanobacteria bacterium J06642_11]